MKAHTITSTTMRSCIVAMPIAELAIVAIPVAVESRVPSTASRCSNLIVGIATRTKVENDQHIVAGTTVFPTMKGHHFVGVIDMKDIHMLPLQSSRVVVPVATQPDYLTIQLIDAVELVELVPVNAILIAKTNPL